MKLTPRLQAIADQVPPGSRVADIGTDHGYIPVYLLINRLSPCVIASDSRQGPLAKARDNLNLFGLGQVSQLRLGKGLSILSEEDRVDAIIIAGMGGETICAILNGGRQFLETGPLLILQPMTFSGRVRKWLWDNGFTLLAEDIALESEEYYEIIVAKWTGKPVEVETELAEIGPLLVADRHPLLQPMLSKRLKSLEQARAAAAQSDSATARERVAELEREIETLRGAGKWK